MLLVRQNGANRIDLELDGKLDADEMRIALDELIKKTEQVQKGQMLYRIRNFSLPTLGAVSVELSRLPKLLRLVSRFDRVAVMAEAEWILKFSVLEGALIPGLEIKGFGLDQERNAEAWLARP